MLKVIVVEIVVRVSIVAIVVVVVVIVEQLFKILLDRVIVLVVKF